MARTISLYESALARGRVVRAGDLVQIIFDGGGAMVTTTQEFQQAQKWAQRKPGSSNMLSDRGRFLEQITILIARPGSMQGTRGNARYLENLARQMMQGGYDLNEWMLPPELKRVGHAPVVEPHKRTAKDASAETAAPPEDQPPE